MASWVFVVRPWLGSPSRARRLKALHWKQARSWNQVIQLSSAESHHQMAINLELYKLSMSSYVLFKWYHVHYTFLLYTAWVIHTQSVWCHLVLGAGSFRLQKCFTHSSIVREPFITGHLITGWLITGRLITILNNIWSWTFDHRTWPSFDAFWRL